MKKIVAISVVLMMTLVVVPGITADTPEKTYNDINNAVEGIPTSVTVNQGSGSAPWIKAKWETINSPGTDHYVDDDMNAVGIQIDPVLFGTKTVYYYAVVTDFEGVDSVDKVYVDVYHPDGQFKYQFELENEIMSAQENLDLFQEVYANNPTIIEFSGIQPYGYPTGYDDIVSQLSQGLSRIWWGSADLSYCQPAGLYEVRTTAVDNGNLWAADLINYFWYVPTIGVDYDFTTIDYGSANLYTEKQLPGDYDFGTANKPTVRNTGNVPVEFSVWQNDMGFGKTGTNWNVKYGARLGDAIDGTKVEYYPEETAILPDELPLCTMEKMDFFITVLKAPHIDYTGLLHIYATMYGDPAVTPYVTPSQFVG